LPQVLVGVALSAGALAACGAQSEERDESSHETGGNSGASGSTSGASGSSSGTTAVTGGSSGNTGGASGSPQGGTGGSGRGGQAGSPAGRGGSNEGGESGTGGSSGGCPGDGTVVETRRYGQHARSSGFSGTDTQYGELYDVLCASVDDCIDPCTMRGGSNEMCEATTCQDSTFDYCLPPTVWRNLTALRAEGVDPEDGAVLTLVFNPYQDFLLVDDFKLEVPSDAEIVGITVTIRRAGGSSMEAVDGAVRLMKGGIVGTSDRSVPTPWTGPAYVNVDYGGPTDLWGQTWTPADVNSANFGVALSALYTDTAGNGRAYVDIVYVTVHYRTTCN
jgi:hypothetical protein